MRHTAYRDVKKDARTTITSNVSAATQQIRHQVSLARDDIAIDRAAIKQRQCVL